MESVNDTLKKWREVYDAMNAASKEVDEQIKELMLKKDAIELPYWEQLEPLEGEIMAYTHTVAQSFESQGVKVSYRKGYEKVTYDRKGTDAVWSTLRDILPNTADALERARKVSYVSPSVSVKAAD